MAKNISVKLFQNLTSSCRGDFLRISSCPYSASNPHSQEPCLLTDQNFANIFSKGSPKEYSPEIISKSYMWFRRRRVLICWLYLGFNFNAKVISCQSVTHTMFPGFLTPVLTLFFPKPPITFLTCFCRGERPKYTVKKSRLNQCF